MGPNDPSFDKRGNKTIPYENGLIHFGVALIRNMMPVYSKNTKIQRYKLRVIVLRFLETGMDLSMAFI